MSTKYLGPIALFPVQVSFGIDTIADFALHSVEARQEILVLEARL